MAIAFGLEQNYSDKTAITVNRGTIVMYPVHNVLLKFIVKIRQNVVYHAHTPLRFPLVCYEEGSSGVEIF